MTVADDVLRALHARPTGMTDAELATVLGKRHQHINQTCRALASQRLIERDNTDGGIINKISGDVHLRPPHEVHPAASLADQDWAWEGNVQAQVVTHLAGGGWSIVRVADTAQRERGIDIIAERGGERLLVEIKGWPSTVYARGEHGGQPKPTRPTLQATHWFAEVLASLIRRGSEPGVRLAMGLPDIPRYRTLLGEAAWALDRLSITAYLVSAEGSVKAWERED